MPEQEPVLRQTIRIFGQAEQTAYERTVSMREVVFTCIVCQKQTTQLRYPGPPPRYCSEDCRAAQEQILNRERVRKQREKRRAVRVGREKIANTVRETNCEQQMPIVLRPLLASKLSPPRLSALLIERSRLLALLDGGQRQKLTLLQAPAGFGKTTLVNQWIAHRQEQAVIAEQAPLAVAWLALDSGDNDPIRFWTAMISACQSFDAQIGETAFAQLSQIHRPSFSSSPLETTLTLLLNDLMRCVQGGLLILEDYHLIEHVRIHETLAFFIEHLPASLHVVMLTRSEPPLPLVRWRARGDLLEVQSAQLRFSVEETVSFLQQMIPLPERAQQALSEEAVNSLHRHLEGWAAGLRLFALSMQGQMAPQAVEEYLAQLNNGKAVSRSHRPIQEYFMSEVFSTLPTLLTAGAGFTPAPAVNSVEEGKRAGVNPAPAVHLVEPFRLFLLQTSILSRLTGSLCDAVTGRQDGAEWLEMAERSGFFLELLDSGGEWYRYHALFAETMRAEAVRLLGEEALRSLSLKASRWYEEHSMPVEAIEAALYARESEYAAHLIERLMEEVAYFSEQHTLLRWLEQLPKTLLRAHSALCFCYAQALYISEEDDVAQLRMKEIEEWLQMAEEGWRKQGDMLQVGMLYAFRTTLVLIRGYNTSAAGYARLALQFSPLATEQTSDYQLPIQRQPAEWIDWRCGCLVALGMESMQEGHFDRARQFMLEAYTLSLKVLDRTFTRILGRQLGDICVELGELHQAAGYYQSQILTDTQKQLERGEDVIHASSVCGMARLAYERNELARAEQLAHEVSEYRFSGYLQQWEEEARARGDFVRVLVLHARGEVALAQQQLSALFVRLQASVVQNPNMRQLIPDILTWQVRWQIIDGDLSAARRTLSLLASYEKELFPLQIQGMQLLRARLLLARGETAAALHALGQLLIVALEGKHILRALEIQLVIALAHAADGQEQKARQWLYEVLSQARNEGFMRFFLDEGEPLAALLRSLLPSLIEKPLRSYARSILHAFTDPLHAHSTAGNSAESSLLEPLSAQEQRVLALLVAGRSNPEIAETLIVSVNTVKGHVKNLYRKLGVNSRVQAGEVARQFKLI